MFIIQVIQRNFALYKFSYTAAFISYSFYTLSNVGLRCCLSDSKVLMGEALIVHTSPFKTVYIWPRDYCSPIYSDMSGQWTSPMPARPLLPLLQHLTQGTLNIAPRAYAMSTQNEACLHHGFPALSSLSTNTQRANVTLYPLRQVGVDYLNVSLVLFPHLMNLVVIKQCSLWGTHTGDRPCLILPNTTNRAHTYIDVIKAHLTQYVVEC